MTEGIFSSSFYCERDFYGYPAQLGPSTSASSFKQLGGAAAQLWEAPGQAALESGTGQDRER